MSAALVARLLRDRAGGVEDAPGEMLAEFLCRMASLLEAPRPVLIGEGTRLRTESGRIITVPRFKGAFTTRLRALDAWMHAEALLEARATAAEFVGVVLASMDPARLSRCDRDSLNDILFGSERGVTTAHVVTEEVAHDAA